jgi:hypothetical protein
MPHLGQSIRNASSPWSCAPNVKFGGVLQVEQTKVSVPFRALIPERCISIMVSDLTLGRSREWPLTSAGGLCFRPAQMCACRNVGRRTVIAAAGAAPGQLAILTRDANEIRALHVNLALHAWLIVASRKRRRSPRTKIQLSRWLAFFVTSTYLDDPTPALGLPVSVRRPWRARPLFLVFDWTSSSCKAY